MLAPSMTGGRAPLCVGSYTSGISGGRRGYGLAVVDVPSCDGEIELRGVVEGVPDPSFLALSPDRSTLYAVNEVPGGQGQVTALRFDDTGWPRVLGRQSTGGTSPAHLSVHPSGRFVLVANYGSGSVAVHPVRPDGSLDEPSTVVQHTGSGPIRPQQSSSHPHMVVTDPSGQWILVVDLGTDHVYVYRLDEAKGALTEHGRTAVLPGAGPRHLVFHPNGRYAYLVNELNSSVTACRWSTESGELRLGQGLSTLEDREEGRTENWAGAVLISSDGRFVYATNRGDDSIAMFAVVGDGERLGWLGKVPCGGSWPRHAALCREGDLLYVANQRSGELVTFTVNRRTGRLTPAGAGLPMPEAACVLPID